MTTWIATRPTLKSLPPPTTCEGGGGGAWGGGGACLGCGQGHAAPRQATCARACPPWRTATANPCLPACLPSSFFLPSFFLCSYGELVEQLEALAESVVAAPPSHTRPSRADKEAKQVGGRVGAAAAAFSCVDMACGQPALWRA